MGPGLGGAVSSLPQIILSSSRFSIAIALILSQLKVYVSDAIEVADDCHPAMSSENGATVSCAGYGNLILVGHCVGCGVGLNVGAEAFEVFEAFDGTGMFAHEMFSVQ